MTETVDASRTHAVALLRKKRDRNGFLRASAAVALLLVGSAWMLGGLEWGDALTPRRMSNLSRFAHEVVPYPIRAGEPALGTLGGWTSDLLRRRGGEAIVQTLALSVAAIVLAGAMGLAASIPAARNVAAAEPFSTPAPRPRGAALAWRTLVGFTRLGLTFARAIPEYVWAFLLLAMLGQQAWPPVLALAIHNAGILGRLGAEVVENVEPGVPRALRALGGTRLQVAAVGVLPLVLPRFLLYFFYRWETCVREATVLGLLGFTSLGYWIADARARDRYDEMMLFILLGAGLVLLGDVVSAVTRSFVRRAA